MVSSFPGYPISESFRDIFSSVNGAVKSMAINFLNRLAPNPEYPSNDARRSAIMEKQLPQDRLSIFIIARFIGLIWGGAAHAHPAGNTMPNTTDPQMIYNDFFTEPSFFESLFMATHSHNSKVVPTGPV